MPPSGALKFLDRCNGRHAFDLLFLSYTGIDTPTCHHVGMEKFTVMWLAAKLQSDADAYKYLEELRWGDEPVCPHCGVIGGHYFLKPANGISRETSRGKQSQRRTWKCSACREQFSVTTGTVMHGSHVSLRVWLLIFFEMASNKNGIAAREIERKYGVNARTAWHLTQRIREAMVANPSNPLAGTWVADETWVGGTPKYMHANKRNPESRQGHTDKTTVFSLIHLESGTVRSAVIQGAHSSTIRPVIKTHVDVSMSTLYTDASIIYRDLGKTFAAHEFVNHAAGEYVHKAVSTNPAENFFSQVKRSINGTHHRVSEKHLSRYLAEFDFRYSTRDDTDKDRMAKIIRRTAGRSLPYDVLRGAVG